MAKKKRVNRKLRARNAVLRKIAETDKISFTQAREKFPRAIVEYIYNRAYEAVHRRFVEVGPKKYQEVPKGKKLTRRNAEGPIREYSYLERVRRMESYWRTVHLYEEIFHVSTTEARRRYKTLGRQHVMEEMGNFANYRYRPVKEREEND